MKSKTAVEMINDIMLENVHPDIRVRARRVLADVKNFLDKEMKITESLRDFEKQRDVYAQGRTDPGKIATNARPGYSFHQYGLAIDCCFAGADPYLENLPKSDFDLFWNSYGKFAVNHGFIWGGNFKMRKDRPHIELSYGMRIQECLEEYRIGGVTRVWGHIDAAIGHSTTGEWPDWVFQNPVDLSK